MYFCYYSNTYNSYYISVLFLLYLPEMLFYFTVKYCCNNSSWLIYYYIITFFSKLCSLTNKHCKPGAFFFYHRHKFYDKIAIKQISSILFITRNTVMSDTDAMAVVLMCLLCILTENVRQEEWSWKTEKEKSPSDATPMWVLVSFRKGSWETFETLADCTHW